MASIFSGPVLRWIISAIIMAIFIGLAFLSRVILNTLLRTLASRTKTELDDLIIKALFGPVFAGVITIGLWIALVQLPELDPYQETIDKVFTVIAIIIVAIAAARIMNALAVWYTREIAVRTKTDLDDKLLPVLSRVGNIVIYAIAIMIILDQLKVNISPLIAGLGIGGLAVALALQTTLSNFLAGTYVMSDAVIRKGHYILLDSGQEGTVEEIGWRTTKIKHWQGNYIVLPNSKLAEAIVTDYELPDVSMSFPIACGVSYDSDLEIVEKVSVEVAQQVIKINPEGFKDFTPVVRFGDFGDSNINFSVILKANDRASSFKLKHEFIKAINKRFKDEGIEMQYPTRKIYFANSPQIDKNNS